VFIALVLLIAGGVLLGAVLALLEAIRNRRRKPLWRSIAHIAAALLVLYGFVGFFGAALSATGGLRWLPSTTQFPVGFVDGAVTDREGNLYCPSTPFGRIQVYDRNRHFLRGWFVDASGGSFRIHMDPEDRLEVVTARGQTRFLFDSRGNQISKSHYPPKSYSDFDHWKGVPVWIPTPICLLPLSSPFGSLGTALLGIVVLNWTGRKKRRSPRDAPTPTDKPPRSNSRSDLTRRRADMATKLYLILSGAIFLLVAVLHLCRLIYHWPIVVGPRTIPFVLSYVGLPVSAAYWAWAIWLLFRDTRPR